MNRSQDWERRHPCRRIPTAPPQHAGKDAGAPSSGSGIDQAVEDAADGWVEGEGHLVGGRGAGDVEPIGAKTERSGIALSLETPANVVGGPQKREEVPRHDVRDRNRGGANDA